MEYQAFQALIWKRILTRSKEKRGLIITDMDEFSRTRMLLGTGAMEKLKSSRVLVFGVGGVGSHAIEALARAGVGKLIIVDHDIVSVTNINRQSIALHSTVGRPKVEVMKEKLHDISGEIEIKVYKEFVLPENVDQIIQGEIDYIIDAVDTVTAKLAIAKRANELKIPLISSMGTGNKLDPGQFEITDIYKTSVCPLCKVMRRELKRFGIDSLKVLYSREIPRKTLQEEDGGDAKTKRSVPGSVSFVPPVAGLMIASFVVRKLIGE
jgi:tRNA A37 threonylcarbamoyladenosine dehydratase